jgi:D-alanyl-D-alanine carboxypeptidase/D-alanyl-D-alanine-endopeptidase (penicillin-binding protein 4)
MKFSSTLNIFLALNITGLICTQAIANDQTDKIWNQQLKAQAIAAKDQSYCYTDEKGKAQGSNLDMRIRLASVSKLLTSLWAVEKLGVDYKYDTKLFIKGNNLHIQGSYDPYLGNEKMFYLISQLNELGYDKFDTITFDKNVVIYPDVAYEVDEYPTINATTMGRVLRNYFNTKAWSPDSKNEYANFFNLAKTGKFRKVVNFEVQNVQMVDTNPFAGDDSVKVLTLSSPGLYKYLKQMNVKSNNYIAETVFRQNGGVANFSKFLSDRFSLTADQIRFYSGSGLPTVIDGVRKDNYATCNVMLDLISELKGSIEKQGRTIEDLVAVPGSDGGTFRNRVFPSDFKNSFVAKTGTLMHTSTLAGAMNTQNGFSFFGVFNQSTDISGSKIVQNAMVKSIMTEMGGPKTFNYEVEGFHPDNGDTLKSFEEPTDFSPIEQSLF